MIYKKQRNLVITVLGFIISSYPVNSQGNQTVDNRNHKFKLFSSAKKAVFLVAVNQKTFYCNCAYDSDKNIDLRSCGYIARKSPKRASHVEIEHVVPADKLCGNTSEWMNGGGECVDSKGKSFKGRRCASEHNSACIMAYNDLHNLRPAIGELNGDRSNFDFGEISGQVSKYGKCDFKIVNHIADPPDGVQGDIARIYLFMNEAYPELKILTEPEIKLFKKWDLMDPVTEQECTLNENIYRQQGTYDIMVKAACSKFDLHQ